MENLRAPDGDAQRQSADTWLDRVASIRQWTRRGERAPHKPLLLLYAIGRLQQDGQSAVSFTEAEPDLAALLEEFGPRGRSTSPAYPFHHLQSDGLWTVRADGNEPGASVTKLRATNAVGSLNPDFEAALRTDARLTTLVVSLLLDENYEPSLHEEICSAVGLDLDGLQTAAAHGRAQELRRQRDPRFRQLVLVAYEFRCAMCGFDGRLDSSSVALDAAHVRWWAFEGPDSVDNALCLCTFHHKLLDRGVVGISDDHRVAVSSHFVGRGRTAEELVLRLVGEPILAPQRGTARPHDDHVEWHTREVFCGPARTPA
jgi:putative restriction endonuclease